VGSARVVRRVTAVRASLASDATMSHPTKTDATRPA
jgi:hypothetical protein